jgi:hypothetical protein
VEERLEVGLEIVLKLVDRAAAHLMMAILVQTVHLVKAIKVETMLVVQIIQLAEAAAQELLERMDQLQVTEFQVVEETDCSMLFQELLNFMQAVEQVEIMIMKIIIGLADKAAVA